MKTDFAPYTTVSFGGVGAPCGALALVTVVTDTTSAVFVGYPIDAENP